MHQLAPDTQRVLNRIRNNLAGLYGNRYQGLVLYGSEARGDAGTTSDIDLLVLLDGPISWWRDMCTITNALYPETLELGRSIHARPVQTHTFETAPFPLYIQARLQGLRL